MKVFITLIFTLIAWSLALGCCAAKAPKMTYRQNKVLYQAQKALELGDTKQCSHIIRQHLEIDKAVPVQFYSLLGSCQHRQNHYQAAAESFREALKLEPGDVSLSNNLAICLYLNTDYIPAGEQFAESYRIGQSQEPEYLYQAAVSYYMGKAYKKTRDHIQQLLAVTTQHETAWKELLLSSLIELKYWNEAQKLVQKLIKHAPLHAPYWQLSVQLYLQKEKYTKAAWAMEALHRLKPPSAADLKNLANIYSYLNVPLRAVKLLEKAYGEAPSQKQLIEIAGLYQRGFDYKNATERVEQGLQRWKNSAELKDLYVQLMYQQGRYQELLTSDVSDNRSSTEQSLLQGYAAWHLGQWAQARDFFRQTVTDSRYKERSRHALDVLNLLLQERLEAVERRENTSDLKENLGVSNNVSSSMKSINQTGVCPCQSVMSCLA